MSEHRSTPAFLYSENQLVHVIAEELAVEEPLEIRLGFADENGESLRKTVSITMRTPGHDEELAVGFLFTEGILQHGAELSEVSGCGPLQKGHQNVVRVELHDRARVDLKKLQRNFYTTSSCGVCGKASIEALRVAQCQPVNNNNLTLASAIVHSLPLILRTAQATFERTGGLHASGLFTRTGELIVAREDVGRHNALDKVIGWSWLEGHLPLAQTVLMVSGRTSFELVQKAAMAGIPIIAGVGAPSSLAVELALSMNMTLLGFVRDQRFTVYCGDERITP